MSSSPSPATALDREFLGIRCRLIELAAALDRVDRTDGHPTAHADPRRDQIRRALQILQTDAANRAEQTQGVFSLPYETNWRQPSSP